MILRTNGFISFRQASIGALISAYFSGSLLETMSPTDVFSITAVLPLIVAAIAFFIDEDPVEAKIEANAQFKDTNPSVDLSTTNGIINCDSAMVTTSDGDDGVKQQIASLWSAIKQPAVWKPALFLFLWQSTPTSEGAFLYFMTNDLGMGPEFLGRVRLVTAAASLAGVWGYQKYLRAVSLSPAKSLNRIYVGKLPTNITKNHITHFATFHK